MSHIPAARGQADRAVDLLGVRVRIVHYLPGRRMKTHAHESASITLVIRGTFEEESALGSIRTGVGDCVIKPPGVPHADHFGDWQTTTLQIAIPGDSQALHRDGDFALRGYRCGADPRLAPVLFNMFRILLNPEGGNPEPALSDLTLDALGMAAAQTRRIPVTRPLWLARVENEIRASVPGMTRVAKLAEAVGVHPVHMARVFQRVHGCGVVEYIRRLRVQYAAHAMARRRTTLCEAALDAGFFDQPHLNRAFRRQLGLSPARYRRLANVEADLKPHSDFSSRA
jgi:AraC family transcriptional regulator